THLPAPLSAAPRRPCSRQDRGQRGTDERRSDGRTPTLWLTDRSRDFASVRLGTSVDGLTTSTGSRSIPPWPGKHMADHHYDVVVAGTSFASTFFLHKFLERFPNQRVLVLERGQRKSQKWRLEHGRVSTVPEHEVFTNRTPQKSWEIHVTFGGNSNSWWACTP